MKTCFVGSSECLGLPIHYSLLFTKSDSGTEQYGVLVEYDHRQVSIPDITTSRKNVQSLIDLLIQGNVTPHTVRDVVDDWLLQ